tara:strand:- start:13295 stop:14674 length:1380 start_codon:yes stop_codon:yes gene_type:complete
LIRHSFDPTILREYDIRGVFNKNLSKADAKAVGLSFGTVVKESGGITICVGYDGRFSSLELENNAVEGLLSCGLKISRIGLCSTPMLYYAVHKLQADAGLMVSGSHNPPEHNGFKMVLDRRPFFGGEIKKLGKISSSGNWSTGKGVAEDVNIFDEYVQRLRSDFRGEHSFKVAWDAGNGSAGPAMSAICSKLPGEHILMNAEVDGSFPNHHPDPTVPEYLRQLQMEVCQSECDLGFAFDGDGDRLGVVDGKGRIIWGDQLMVFFAADVLKENPGAKIIADVKASQILFDEIARMGGKPVMWRTGHSVIKSHMAEIGAPLAGEMSGHIFFADKWFGFDDGLYAAVRLLNFLDGKEHSLAEIFDNLPKAVNTPELRFQCNDTRKFDVIKEVYQRVRSLDVKINIVDGLRVQNADGWWLLRASNTQDALVARCEAEDLIGLQRLRDTLVSQLCKSGVEPPSF